MLHVEPKKLHLALVPGRKTKGLTAIASKPWNIWLPDLDSNQGPAD